jgi:prepilin-type processing-associated H-X9-DG protein
MGLTMTSYVAVVGPDTAWPGSQPAAYRDIMDGSPQTIHIVEIADSGIHWMEPRDLHFAQMAPTIDSKSGLGFSSRHSGGAHALLCDGSAVFFNEKMSAESLRAWLTAHAGDRPDDF